MQKQYETILASSFNCLLAPHSGCGCHPRTKALWQISDEHFAEALELPPGSSAVQGQNVAARGAESMQQGFTQILNNVEVQGEYDMKINKINKTKL
jgi:hypothetical protein